MRYLAGLAAVLAALLALTIPTAGASTAGLAFAGFGDKVGSWARATPDGTRDGHFRLTIQAGSGLRVTGIVLRTADSAGRPCCGQVWDTTPGGYFILGVYRGATRLNPTDVAISDAVSGAAVYDLYGQDSGYFKNGQKFRVDVSTSAGTITAVTTIGAPSRMAVSFQAYANNVRVLPPLIGRWQLGVARIQGSGSISGGTMSITFTSRTAPLDPKYEPAYITARASSATLNQAGATTTLTATVRITASSRNGDQCEVGAEGTLRLIDSSATISNGQTADGITIGSWSSPCGFVMGWNNADQGARTSPPTGGPPNGGNWAIVSIR